MAIELLRIPIPESSFIHCPKCRDNQKIRKVYDISHPVSASIPPISGWNWECPKCDYQQRGGSKIEGQYYLTIWVDGEIDTAYIQAVMSFKNDIE